jgi:uncharacterized membrane protein SirB2
VDYAFVKTVHEGTVALSFLGFFARGVGSLAQASWVRSGVARSVPHVVDSVLLLSALTLAWMLRINPAATPWLMAKIIGLVVYVGLGIVALRPGPPKSLQAAAWLAALVTFVYIVSVAITKSPLGFLRQAWE